MPPKKKGKGKPKKEKAPPRSVLEMIRITSDELKTAEDPFAFIVEQLSRQARFNETGQRPFDLHNIVESARAKHSKDEKAAIAQSRKPKPPKIAFAAVPRRLSINAVAPVRELRVLKHLENSLTLRVECGGQHFKVPCSDGSQPVKWLGVAATQRLLVNSQAHGRKRAREKYKGVTVPAQGFILPGAVFKKTRAAALHGKARGANRGMQKLDPNTAIKDAFKHGDHCLVELAAQLDQSKLPQMATTKYKSPSFTPFVKRAFDHTHQVLDESKALSRPIAHQGSFFLTALDAHTSHGKQGNRVGDIARLGINRKKREETKEESLMKVLNAKVAFKANIRKKANKLDNAHFREVMSCQTSALSAEDLAQEHAIMAAQDVSQMCVEGFIRPRCKVPTDLKYAIKDCRKVLQAQFGTLSNGYLHFSALDDSKYGGTSTLSFTQYEHFCIDCNLFQDKCNGPEEQKKDILRVLSEMKNDHKQVGGADSEMQRCEFIEVLLRLATELFPKAASTAKATKLLLELQVLPLLEELGCGYVRVIS